MIRAYVRENRDIYINIMNAKVGYVLLMVIRTPLYI